MSRDEREQKIYRLLDDLGTTPEEIAAFLEGQGVTGVRRIPERCPVAVYLARAIGSRVFAGSGRIQVMDEERFEIATPRPVANFIWAFDGGQFRALLTRP